MEKIKVGVVGVGYFGQFHAEKYAKIEDAELVGVVDVEASRADALAKRCQTRSFRHPSDLFDKVQAVDIAVPTPFHYDLARDFFLQGIDVLLEKPISSTLKEAEDLIRLSRSKKRILQVGHLERFNGALLGLEGKITKPQFIEAYRLSPFLGRGMEVDVVLDLMIHDLDILLSLVRSKVKKIQAVGIPILTRTSDIANARIEFANGCIATLTASRVASEKARRTRIYESHTLFSIDYPSQKLTISQKKAVSEADPHPGFLTEEVPVRKTDLLEAELRSFLHCVRTREKPCVSGMDGKRALELALQIIGKMGQPKQKSGRTRSG